MDERSGPRSFAGEREAFGRMHGREPAVTASAPGRVNLIGDHTDYNGGFVLPRTLPQHTRVALAPRVDGRVRAASGRWPRSLYTYSLGCEARSRGWIDYVQAVTATLLGDRRAIGGFDLWIASDIPLGAGLSSSAALMVALLRGLRDLYELELDDLALALVAHRAESSFVGVPVGVMDPIAVSLGDERSALLLDTRSLAIERVALPDALGLVVIDSGIDHALTGGDYGARRAECDEAASRLGVEQLRDLAEGADLTGLPETLARRVRHVLAENARVAEAAEALRRGDLARLGALFDASHRSLAEDYEVSLPELDRLAACARRCGALGARLTGGGFGGSIVAVAAAGEARSVAEETLRAYLPAARTPAVILPWTPAEPEPG